MAVNTIVPGCVLTTYKDCVCKGDEFRLKGTVKVSSSEESEVYFSVGRILFHKEKLLEMKKMLPKEVFSTDALCEGDRCQCACRDVDGYLWTEYLERAQQLVLMLDALDEVEKLGLTPEQISDAIAKIKASPQGVGNFSMEHME